MTKFVKYIIFIFGDYIMKFYLVDYENVHISGFDGLKNLDANSKICIFYSQNADTMTFGLHRRLSETAAEVEYFLVDNSVKNGLDFQLIFYAGYLAKSLTTVRFLL